MSILGLRTAGPLRQCAWQEHPEARSDLPELSTLGAAHAFPKNVRARQSDVLLIRWLYYRAKASNESCIDLVRIAVQGAIEDLQT